MIESALQGQMLPVPLPEVPLAHHPGCITGGTQGLGDGALIQQHAVARCLAHTQLRAVLPGIAAGEQGGAGWRAHGLDVKLCKLDSLVGYAIHVGRGHLLAAVESGQSPWQVV